MNFKSIPRWRIATHDEAVKLLRSGKALLALDTETGGFRLDDRLLEVGVSDGELTHSRRVRMPEGYSPHPRALQVNGLSREVLAGERSIEEVLPKLFEFLSGRTLTGWNLSFDLRFLAFEAHRLDLHAPPGLAEGPHICLKALSHRLYPSAPSHKLEGMARHLQVPFDDLTLHTAGDDAKLTALVGEKLRTRVGENFRDLGLTASSESRILPANQPALL